MLTQPAAALAAAGSAVGVVVVVALFVWLRRAPGASPADLSGRGRFPARAIERAVVVAVCALTLASLAVLDMSTEVQAGVVAVVVAAVWMWWRGSFLALRAGPSEHGGPRG